MPPPWRYTTALPGGSPVERRYQVAASSVPSFAVTENPSVSTPSIGAEVAPMKSNMRWPLAVARNVADRSLVGLLQGVRQRVHSRPT